MTIPTNHGMINGCAAMIAWHLYDSRVTAWVGGRRKTPFTLPATMRPPERTPASIHGLQTRWREARAPGSRLGVGCFPHQHAVRRSPDR